MLWISSNGNCAEFREKLKDFKGNCNYLFDYIKKQESKTVFVIKLYFLTVPISVIRRKVWVLPKQDFSFFSLTGNYFLYLFFCVLLFFSLPYIIIINTLHHKYTQLQDRKGEVRSIKLLVLFCPYIPTQRNKRKNQSWVAFTAWHTHTTLTTHNIFPKSFLSIFWTTF